MMQTLVGAGQILFMALGIVALVWLSAYGIVSWLRKRIHHEHANNGTGEILVEAQEFREKARCEREIAEDRQKQREVAHAGF